MNFEYESFLFQIGSIKSNYLCVNREIKISFLFQIGSIKSNRSATVTIAAARFLFQIGSIKSRTRVSAWANVFNVSIPNWFD